MVQAEKRPPALSWQDLICRLDGVYAAKVVLNEEDAPEEIHILGSTSKSPKSLTRDVQSALMAAFGIEVDYRVISIAQVHPELAVSGNRLRYMGIDNKYINGHGEITVYLSCGDTCLEGSSSYTVRNSTSHLRGIALATIDAISKYIAHEGSIQFEVLSSEIIDMGGKSANLVTLCDDQGQCYIGSSFIREHHDDAVVRAVLDALNRRIARFAAG